MGIVKKGCTEIKLKKIQNVYRKYFNDYDYDEEKHSMIMMKRSHKSILIKSNMYMINLNVMFIAIMLNSNLTSKQKNKKILQVLETV